MTVICFVFVGTDNIQLQNNCSHYVFNKMVPPVEHQRSTSSQIEGVYEAGISTAVFSISGIGTNNVNGVEVVGTTGIVTHFNMIGDISAIQENDILIVNSERVRVLNTDPISSRVRVLRAIDGTTGTAHTVTSIVNEDPRKIKINAGFTSTYEYTKNKEIYFGRLSSIIHDGLVDDPKPYRKNVKNTRVKN